MDTKETFLWFTLHYTILDCTRQYTRLIYKSFVSVDTQRIHDNINQIDLIGKYFDERLVKAT